MSKLIKLYIWIRATFLWRKPQKKHCFENNNNNYPEEERQGLYSLVSFLPVSPSITESTCGWNAGRASCPHQARHLGLKSSLMGVSLGRWQKDDWQPILYQSQSNSLTKSLFKRDQVPKETGSHYEIRTQRASPCRQTGVGIHLGPLTWQGCCLKGLTLCFLTHNSGASHRPEEAGRSEWGSSYAHLAQSSTSSARVASPQGRGVEFRTGTFGSRS